MKKIEIREVDNGWIAETPEQILVFFTIEDMNTYITEYFNNAPFKRVSSDAVSSAPAMGTLRGPGAGALLGEEGRDGARIERGKIGS